EFGPRLRCLVLGTSDLSKELRLTPDESRLGLLAPLSWCICAARASGLDVLDGVHLDFSDAEGFKRTCLQGRQLGFDGKTLIHPSQIEAANEVFSPGDDAVKAAQEIIDVWNRAIADGKGIVVVRGRLVENLHVDDARRTLALRDAIRARRRSL
ncbi:MAG TPA: aldolase/citrate lyase family protein, partial [Gammaproteobacteria bacterium]